MIPKLSFSKTKKKKTLVSGNAGEEKHFRPGRRKFIYFHRFSEGILFSSLVSFAFLILVFFCLFFEIKNEI